MSLLLFHSYCYVYRYMEGFVFYGVTNMDSRLTNVDQAITQVTFMASFCLTAVCSLQHALMQRPAGSFHLRIAVTAQLLSVL
jgi:hypothetical protein